MKPIPVHAARHIAEYYGYDQVIIIARKVGEDPAPHGEHCTTYGRDEAHCAVAARCGDFLKHKVMGWHAEQAVVHEPKAAAPRGKPCTCDNCLGSSIPCHVESGGKLGALWYCRKAAERDAAKAFTRVSVCGKPTETGARVCQNPPGHEGDCDGMPF